MTSQQESGNQQAWRGIDDLSEALSLVDKGILLTWKNARALLKNLQSEQMEQLLKHFGARFCERIDSRLALEIILESYLNILSNAPEERYFAAFIDEVLLDGRHADACVALTEVAINSELCETAHGDVLYANAIALVCELGATVAYISKNYPQELDDVQRIMSHLSTYLLSVSNTSNPCIRLSLVHYFGNIEIHAASRPGFNKVMGRFGHTVLEHLFTQLFQKRTEGMALLYLMETIPFILAGDNHCQTILHDNFKYYMLKHPERFMLFMSTLSENLNAWENPKGTEIRLVFLQHITALLHIASNIGHRELGRELMLMIISYPEEQARVEMIDRIRSSGQLKRQFAEAFDMFLRSQKMGKSLDKSVNHFRGHRRGRKPSFAKVDEKNVLRQITFLGQRAMQKAS